MASGSVTARRELSDCTLRSKRAAAGGAIEVTEHADLRAVVADLVQGGGDNGRAVGQRTWLVAESRRTGLVTVVVTPHGPLEIIVTGRLKRTFQASPAGSHRVHAFGRAGEHRRDIEIARRPALPGPPGPAEEVELRQPAGHRPDVPHQPADRGQRLDRLAPVGRP